METLSGEYQPSLPPLNFTLIVLSRYLARSKIVSFFFFSLSLSPPCYKRKVHKEMKEGVTLTMMNFDYKVVLKHDGISQTAKDLIKYKVLSIKQTWVCFGACDMLFYGIFQNQKRAGSVHSNRKKILRGNC